MTGWKVWSTAKSLNPVAGYNCMVGAEYTQYRQLELRHVGTDKHSPQPPLIEGRVFPPQAAVEKFSLQRNNKEIRIPVSDVYPVTEDLRFLRDNDARMTPEQREYYLRENVIAFVEEFAGKIPLKRVTGLVLANELQMGGFDMLAAGKRAVEFKQHAGLDNEREQAELAGLQKIHQILQSGAAKGVAWTSASKVADYLMLFGFEVGEFNSALGGRPVSEYIYRKDERLGSVDVSRNLHQRLTSLTGKKQETVLNTAEDMLRNPIPFGGSLTVESLSGVVEIAHDQIQFSQEYGRKAREQLSPLIDDYITLVNSYNFLDINNPAKIHLKLQFQREAQPLIDKMYSVGVQLRRSMEGKLPNVAENNLVAYAEKLPPEMILGGSQCPSWISGSKITDVMSALVESGVGVTEATRMMMGLSKDNIVYMNGVKHLLCECPKIGCSSHHPKRKVLAPIVHDQITCPCCHSSAPYKC